MKSKTLCKPSPIPSLKAWVFHFISTIQADAMAGQLPSDHPVPQFPGVSRGFFIVAVHPGHIGGLETFTQEVSRIISESLKLNPLSSLGQRRHPHQPGPPKPPGHHRPGGERLDPWVRKDPYAIRIQSDCRPSIGRNPSRSGRI